MRILHFDASVCHDKRLLRWEQIFSSSVNAFERKKKKKKKKKKKEEQEIGKQDIRSLKKKGTPWCRSAFQLRCLSGLPNSVLILSALSSCISSHQIICVIIFFLWNFILDLINKLLTINYWRVMQKFKYQIELL